MIVRVGNQTFDSKNIPISLVMSESEKTLIAQQALKPKEQKYIFAWWPGDISPEQIMSFLIELNPEIDRKKKVSVYLMPSNFEATP